jgi:hypothetical protein
MEQIETFDESSRLKEPGTSSQRPPTDETEGFVAIDGAELYRIPDFDRLPPFLIAVTSESDLWMYVSSAGGLTAGRIDADHCIFPYETVDRLHDLYGITGPQTLLRVHRSGHPPVLWEPFATQSRDPWTTRNLYKNALGNRLVFEEIHHHLQLSFTYTWRTSARFGFVRTARLTNHDEDSAVRVDVLDGLLNILPAGVPLSMQQGLSCLVDAYKQTEIDRGTGLAMYYLTSLVSDRPEPAEALTANIVWSRGLNGAAVLLRDEVRRSFRQRGELTPDQRVVGRRGAFFVRASPQIEPRQRIEWDIICDADRDHADVASLRTLLRSGADQIRAAVAEDCDRSERGLLKILAEADGLQVSGQRMACTHHLANVLFNSMRGGVPLEQGKVDAERFCDFVRSRNLPVFRAHEPLLRKLPASLQIGELIEAMQGAGTADLARLAYEYLPLFFSRRHGDPSRPWNRFAIRVRNSDGSARVDYEGNWRDIFQNWEALGISFPSLIESFIAKFVNASTIDGFNPYRITSHGIDWEVPQPDQPFSHIGYWGDHQIVYLLKLLELSRDFHPGRLEKLLAREIYTYAHVPYRLDCYSAIRRNPRQTILWDSAEARRIDALVQAQGADGKLLRGENGDVYHVALIEKLWVPLLSKLSNLVPGGGIWMNTQRPEWNDANNALAGFGLSMVTLACLRRYVRFLAGLLDAVEGESVRLSAEVLDWSADIHRILLKHESIVSQKEISPEARSDFIDELGAAFERYRTRVYSNGFCGKRAFGVVALRDLLALAGRYIDHSLAANWRSDGLFHSYNLLELSENPPRASVRRMHEMLEGQVAILSSAAIDAPQSATLVDAMFKSSLYRADQQSFMLYPLRTLPGFLEKNQIPANSVQSNPLIAVLLAAHNTAIVLKDAGGALRFNRDFHNRRDVEHALRALSADPAWKDLVARHGADLAGLYDKIFAHDCFTGRSCAMYAYEGIGSIYWHMVSKLLLAVQECFWRAVDSDCPAEQIEALAEAYYRVRAGLQFNKTAYQYGAFPADPYSHTPCEGGASQPGMTGLVKEEIIARFGEWGLRVRGGQIHFNPRLLLRSELLSKPSTFSFFSLAGPIASVDLHPGMAAFTFCQTPILYRADDSARAIGITLIRPGGIRHRIDAAALSPNISREIFDRIGSIARIEVAFPTNFLRNG